MAYYDFIRIYGLPSSTSEVFQGLGAAALYNAAESQPLSGGAPAAAGAPPTTPDDTTPEDFPEPLWKTQDEVIKRQSDMLRTIAGTYAEKLAALPQQPTWWGVLFDSAFEWTVDLISEKILGYLNIAIGSAEANPYIAVIEKIASFGIEFAFNAWDYIKKYYNETGLICMQMAEENSAMLNIDASTINYSLRTATLEQHESAMKNIIELIATVEDEMKSAIPQDSMTALVQAIDALRYNGASLQFPDGHVFTMVGATVSQES